MIEKAVDAVTGRIYIQDLRRMLDEVEARNGSRVDVHLVQYPASTTFMAVSWQAH